MSQEQGLLTHELNGAVKQGQKGRIDLYPQWIRNGAKFEMLASRLNLLVNGLSLCTADFNRWDHKCSGKVGTCKFARTEFVEWQNKMSNPASSGSYLVENRFPCCGAGVESNTLNFCFFS